MLFIDMAPPTVWIFATRVGLEWLRDSFRTLSEQAPVVLEISQRTDPRCSGNVIIRAMSIPEIDEQANSPMLVRVLRRLVKEQPSTGFHLPPDLDARPCHAVWTHKPSVWDNFMGLVSGILDDLIEGGHCYLASANVDDAEVVVEYRRELPQNSTITRSV